MSQDTPETPSPNPSDPDTPRDESQGSAESTPVESPAPAPEPQPAAAPAEAAKAKPPADNPLAFTGKFAGGLVLDIKRRIPFYADDIKQGFSSKVVASILFLFFACLANAVAFGGLTGVVTDGQIGTVEMIVATAVGGVVFALLGGQPLTILGGTGPIVIFTGLLYGFCQSWELDFLGVYAWVGLWSGLFMVILAVTDASFLMRYFTRFTDEIFAALIAVIFIVEAVKSMATPFMDDKEGMIMDEATGMFTVILGLGTFVCALQLKRFSETRFLWRGLRNFISDFGPAIAIGLMTVVAVIEPDIHLDSATIPETFGTTTGRPWLVQLDTVPGWAIAASIVPALMATILLFLDQNITTRLVNAPDNKLKKGPAFHLDLLVVGLIIAVSSLFALPWIVAATVHALNHVQSLADTKRVKGKGGESKDVIVSVREQRVSGLMIHILIGVSILLLPLIKLIPMAVLFGLFLYMGVATLSGNQFFERFTLFFTDPKLYPDTHYVKQVKHMRIHVFTLVQVFALGALWVLKASPLGILFPVLIALLVPLRLMLGRYYSEDELHALDAEEAVETQVESHGMLGDAHT